MKISKGCLVRLNKDACFTEKQGGKQEFPLHNYFHDENGTVPAARPITPKETQEWYASDDAVGLGDAVETRLPPQSVIVILHRDRVYHVLKARAQVRLGWGNITTGMIKLLCTYSGQVAYIKRNLVELAQ